MIYVFLTVAQHPKGLGLQFRNLNWALQGVDHKIHVQTFRCWKLPIKDKSEVDANPYQHYRFYDDPNQIAILKDLARQSDGILFMQSDILFFDQIEDQVKLCTEGKIVVNLTCTYLSLYQNQKMLQPRIWEGGTLIPSKIVLDCIDRGVSFGQIPNLLPRMPSLDDIITESAGQYMSVSEYYRSGQFDVMFELNLDCFLQGWQVSNFGGDDMKYRWGKKTIHIAAVDHLFRHNEGLDRHLLNYLKPKSGQRYPKAVNGAAFLCLLSGIFLPCIELGKILRCSFHPDQPQILKRQIALLAKSADKWMSEDQQKRFTWSRKILNVK